MLFKSPKNLKIFFIIFISILLLSLTSSQDYSFFYDNSNNKIYFPIYKEDSLEIETSIKEKEDSILTTSNLKKRYYIETKQGKVLIQHYNINLNNSTNDPIQLIKASLNSTSEILIDHSSYSSNRIFPSVYSNYFSIRQSKDASRRFSEQHNKKIYDVFGFTIKNYSDKKYDIDKVLLIVYKNDEVVYLADFLGVYIWRSFGKEDLYGYYLKNLPENFDIQVTLALMDNEGNFNGEKVVMVCRDYNYPHYKVENDNPNKIMFIISIAFIGLMFIVTLVFVIMTICLAKNSKK